MNVYFIDMRCESLKIKKINVRNVNSRFPCRNRLLNIFLWFSSPSSNSLYLYRFDTTKSQNLIFLKKWMVVSFVIGRIVLWILFKITFWQNLGLIKREELENQILCDTVWESRALSEWTQRVSHFSLSFWREWDVDENMKKRFIFSFFPRMSSDEASKLEDSKEGQNDE